MSWTTKSSRYLLKRWWMNLREDHVLLPDGTELREFHVVEYPDWACVVCRDESGAFIMVDQYRYGIDRNSLEFPAGGIDVGEDPHEAAARELLEETGFAAKRLELLARWAPEPSKHTNWAYVFFADGAVKVAEPTLGAGETLAVRRLSATELKAAIEQGDVVHGIHVAAYYEARAQGWLSESA